MPRYAEFNDNPQNTVAIQDDDSITTISFQNPDAWCIRIFELESDGTRTYTSLSRLINGKKFKNSEKFGNAYPNMVHMLRRHERDSAICVDADGIAHILTRPADEYVEFKVEIRMRFQ